MTEVNFYQLANTSLERVLPRLLERVLASGARALVVAASVQRVELLADLLWIYEAGAFLPHGTRLDGNPAEQPIWLTADDADNANDARILVLVDGVSAPSLARFERCLDIFDGRDPAQLAAARARYKAARDQGCALRFFRQGENGWQAG